MNITKFLFSFILLMLISTNLYSEECKTISINSDNMLMTTVEVEGPRGTLKLPALIDTGASISVIPESIANGIGYSNAQDGSFHTVAGKTKMKIIKLKKLTFLKLDFSSVDVTIEKNKSNKSSMSIEFENMLNKHKVGAVKKPQKVESAIIGMSELTKTNFSYKDGVLTICR